LSSDIDYINSLYPDDVIIIAGDFNQLNTSFFDVDHGLVQMVSSPIHCGHIIDKVFVSRPDLYTCVVVRSVLKTKHCAVILTCPQDACHLPSPRTKRKVKLYYLRSPNIDRLRYYLGVYPWEHLLECNDVEYLYPRFIDII